jgi:phage/plasmid-associated DNA primase
MLDNWAKYFDPNEFNELTSFVNDCMNGISRHNEFLVFVGSGNNGKTTLLNEIINLIGPANCEYTPSHGSYFNMDKKMLCISDVDNNDVNKCSAFIKQIVSRNPITYKKPHHQAETHVPVSNIILIGNTIDNFDYGLIKRAKIIHFNHVFNHHDPINPIEHIDPIDPIEHIDPIDHIDNIDPIDHNNIVEINL